MKQILVMMAAVVLVGCGGEKPLTKEEQAKLIEEAIRLSLGKYNDELTKADLVKVTTLSLSGPNNKLTEVPKGLENLTLLKYLHLDKNKLTDVRGLEKLTHLYLQNNQLTEIPKGLEKLTQLESLWLQDNPALTKAQIDQLQKALPNCEIRYNDSYDSNSTN